MHNCDNTGSPFQILTECENGYIGVCNCCADFNLAYKNILVVFEGPQLFQLLDWLEENRNNPDFHAPLHHGRTHVYRSPVHHLYLTFDNSELDEIHQLSVEVRLLLEARRALAGKPT